MSYRLLVELINSADFGIPLSKGDIEACVPTIRTPTANDGEYRPLHFSVARTLLARLLMGLRPPGYIYIHSSSLARSDERKEFNKRRVHCLKILTSMGWDLETGDQRGLDGKRIERTRPF